jgi:hypothetical protein
MNPTDHPGGDAAGDLQAAVDRLTRVRDRQQALAPLRNLLTDADEDARAAAIAARDAGLSERTIAARIGVAQPTVHAWLDGRAGAPLAEPSLPVRVWALHHIVTAAASETARLIGEQLPEAPSRSHTSPHDAIRTAATNLDETSTRLAGAAAALDFHARSRR